VKTKILTIIAFCLAIASCGGGGGSASSSSVSLATDGPGMPSGVSVLPSVN